MFKLIIPSGQWQWKQRLQWSLWPYTNSRCLLSGQKRTSPPSVFPTIMPSNSIPSTPNTWAYFISVREWEFVHSPENERNAKELPGKKRELHIVFLCWEKWVRENLKCTKKVFVGKPKKRKGKLGEGPICHTDTGKERASWEFSPSGHNQG